MIVKYDCMNIHHCHCVLSWLQRVSVWVMEQWPVTLYLGHVSACLGSLGLTVTSVCQDGSW